MRTINDTKPTTLELMNLHNEWSEKYHTEKDGTIIFQNKKQLSNIRFDNHSFHALTKNSRGAENLPECLMNPDEIWAKWGNKEQTIVLRNYLLFGENITYICQTKDGVFTDGFGVTPSQVDKYRKGLILLR